MRDERNPEKTKEIFIIIGFLFLILVAAIWMSRNEIARLAYLIAYADAEVGYALHNLFGGKILPDAPLLKKWIEATAAVKADPFSGKILGLIGGKYYDHVSRILDRYAWFNALWASAAVGGMTLYLRKAYLKRKSADKPCAGKEKKFIPFGEKYAEYVSPPNRKIEKGIEGAKFVTFDYFPPEPLGVDDECGEISCDDDYAEYVHYSIFYSYHDVNRNRKRYEALKRCWIDIVKTVCGFENGKPRLLPEYYMLMRFKYIDKKLTGVLDNSDERKIFGHPGNVGKEDFPARNVFTESNSPESVKEYMGKYRPECSGDYTSEFLEDLAVFCEIHNFTEDAKVRSLQFAKTDRFYDLSHFGKVPLTREIPKGPTAERELEAVKKYIAERIGKLPYLAMRKPSKIRFMQPVMPRAYILSPLTEDNRLDPDDFTVPGIKVPLSVMMEKTLSDYKKEKEEMIKTLEEEIETLKNSGTATEEEITMRIALLKEIAGSMDAKSEENRVGKVRTLFRTHEFQETLFLALWEYGMSLSNLPTGRFSRMKYENMPLWYAFCNLGGVFYYKPGIPIQIVKEMERERYDRNRTLEEKYADKEKITDVIPKDMLTECEKENF